MRIIVRLALIGFVAVTGAVAAAPVQAKPPALDCQYAGQWYPNGWTGTLDGRWMECSLGLWNMM